MIDAAKKGIIGKAAIMQKVLIVGPFHEEGMRLLEAREDVACEVVDGSSLDEVAARIAEVDGITVRTSRLPGALLEKAERLKVVSRHGVGYDNVDLEVLSRRGIPLAIAADANAFSVAEHTLFLMLALAKQGLAQDRATREGRWGERNRLDRFDLHGRRVLIVGFGRIGREVAVRCEAFGMRVSVCDPYVGHEAIGRSGFHPVDDFRAVLGETDILTVHVPLDETTWGLVGASELAALPPHALVINVARGGIIDEAALIDALRNRTIRGAGLDVFEQEPAAPDNPLFRLDNVVLSPHGAGLTEQSAVRMAISTAKNLLAGLDGNLDPAMVVNRQVLRDPATRS
jgi:D-3-phosphoglycerate dehydrogenase / 2-oxoglutarate reductase